MITPTPITIPKSRGLSYLNNVLILFLVSNRYKSIPFKKINKIEIIINFGKIIPEIIAVIILKIMKTAEKLDLSNISPLYGKFSRFL